MVFQTSLVCPRDKKSCLSSPTIHSPLSNGHCLCCSSVGRTMEEFKTSVNVEAHKKITFELTYEELMKRTHGKYELQIHARPMQPVKDFKVSFLLVSTQRSFRKTLFSTSNCIIVSNVRSMCTFMRKLASDSLMWKEDSTPKTWLMPSPRYMQTTRYSMLGQLLQKTYECTSWS